MRTPPTANSTRALAPMLAAALLLITLPGCAQPKSASSADALQARPRAPMQRNGLFAASDSFSGLAFTPNPNTQTTAAAE